MDISLVDKLKRPHTAPAEKTEKDDAKLQKATKDFEAILIGYMLKTMRNSVPEDSLLGKSHVRDIYQSMADEQLANHIAHGEKSLGIGDALYKELTSKTY